MVVEYGKDRRNEWHPSMGERNMNHKNRKSRVIIMVVKSKPKRKALVLFYILMGMEM